MAHAAANDAALAEDGIERPAFDPIADAINLSTTAARLAIVKVGGRALSEGALAELIAGLPLGRNHRLVESVQELNTLFARMTAGGTRIAKSEYKGAFVQLPNGTTVGLRSRSKSGGPAIDVNMVSRSRIVVIHVRGGG